MCNCYWLFEDYILISLTYFPQSLTLVMPTNTDVEGSMEADIRVCSNRRWYLWKQGKNHSLRKYTS